MKKKDFLILGAGKTGLSAAKFFSNYNKIKSFNKSHQIKEQWLVDDDGRHSYHQRKGAPPRCCIFGTRSGAAGRT